MIASDHRRKANEKALFDEEFMKWFNSVRQLVSAEIDSTRVSTPRVISPELPREIPCKTPLVTPRVSTSGLIPPKLPRDIPRETPLVTPRVPPRDAPREKLSQRVPGSSANGYSHNGSRRTSSSQEPITRSVQLP